MLVDFFAANLSAIIAAVVFVPVLVFSLALFIEGARRHRWPRVRSRAAEGRREPARAGRPAADRRASPASLPRGAGLSHGIAARRDHD